MPRRIDPRIRTIIERQAAANEEAERSGRDKVSAPELLRAIEQLIRAGQIRGVSPDTRPPSERAIREILKRPLDTPDVYRTSVVKWPESFGDGPDRMPWRMADSFLELWRFLGNAPLRPLATWFWRVTEAAPDAPIFDRYSMAAVLAIDECIPQFAPEPPLAPMAGFYIAATPWRSDQHQEHYIRVCPEWARFDPMTPMQDRQSPPLALRSYAADLVYGVFEVWQRDPRQYFDSIESLTKRLLGDESTIAPAPFSKGSRRNFGPPIRDMFDDWIWNEEWAEDADGETFKVSRVEQRSREEALRDLRAIWRALTYWLDDDLVKVTADYENQPSLVIQRHGSVGARLASEESGPLR